MGRYLNYLARSSGDDIINKVARSLYDELIAYLGEIQEKNIDVNSWDFAICKLLLQHFISQYLQNENLVNQRAPQVPPRP